MSFGALVGDSTHPFFSYSHDHLPTMNRAWVFVSWRRFNGKSVGDSWVAAFATLLAPGGWLVARIRIPEWKWLVAHSRSGHLCLLLSWLQPPFRSLPLCSFPSPPTPTPTINRYLAALHTYAPQLNFFSTTILVSITRLHVGNQLV